VRTFLLSNSILTRQILFFTLHPSVDDRITIGYDPSTNNLRGLIATAPIPAGTVLIHTPESLVLYNRGGDIDNKCQLIDAIKNEMMAGTQSTWHTYIEFIGITDSRLPMSWERQGKIVRELQELPPAEFTHIHLDWYQEACVQGQEMTPLDWSALGIYLTRSADIGLVPMYDLMNYHNGKINTKLQRDDTGGGLIVLSSIDIPAGSPIYNSPARGGWKSSELIFNDYGYVEDYPQLWRWTDDEWHQLSHNEWDNAYANNNDFEPNVPAYEVLVVSPTLAAISPSKQLVDTIGYEQRTLEEWQVLIDAHHAILRAPRAHAIRGVARILDTFPTTIEEDEALLASMKQSLEDEKHDGGSSPTVDVEREDNVKAIEFRLAFKKALRLTVEVVDREWERFFRDEL
jgi:hypothetical protein